MKHPSTLCLAAAVVLLGAGPAAAQRSVTGPPPRPATAKPAPAPAPAAPAPTGTSGRADVRPQPAPPATSTYQLGAGDKLNIVVHRDEQLTGPVQVRPDGKITMPLIGDIEAAGKTTSELRDAIAKSLEEYVNNPVVTVVVVEAMAPLAYVMGEVNQAGSIPLHSDLTVLQALALAGGLTDWANTRNIRILRKSSSGVQTITFNYKDAINGGRPVYLRAGDTIVVPD
jgi:polysaccharide export outer membrane protein